MFKLLFKKFMVLVVMFSLTASPIELLAAQKKKVSSKHRTSSYHVKTSHKYGRQKVTFKQRSSRSYSARKAQLASQHLFALDSYDGSGVLQLASSKALIVNQNTGEVIYAKNTNLASPIASITKLMTAMVMLDANLPMDEIIAISDEDVDYLKSTSSRLAVGSKLSRSEFLHLALMASENRAASAIGRNYPGGKYAFVKAMNVKAQVLGLSNTHFVDPTGLDSANVSTAEDLAKMVQAAYQYPEIRVATTSSSSEVYIQGRNYPVNFNNTNGLVRGGEWQIGLSKTGFINEAGRCLVMQAIIAGEPMIVVLLDSNGKLTRIGDAKRIRKWMEYNSNNELKATTTGQSNGVTSGRIS
jgi:serine-type D-Ala-D-Ala endopeptidase (penicillin-binding protein 7)